MMKTPIPLLAALAAASLALAGCGGNAGTPAAPTANEGVTASASLNAADVTFLSDMIPHHEQALLMVEMTKGRDVSPEFAALTQGIAAAQGPEIDQMSSWLDAAGYDVPDSDAHMGMMGDDNGMGMMTDEDAETLSATMGDDFEDMWMRMMIEHHEGAIAMSKVELEEGGDADARALAQRIIDAQEAEIAIMEDLLAGQN